MAKFLGDGQDPIIIGKVFDRVSQLLTAEESVDYMAVALHIPGFPSPDCVVATNRRFMVIRQKLLGRMNFDDFLWMDLHDAQLQEGVLSSTVSFRTTAGTFHKIDYLPKSQARRIYSLCQKREEEAREFRHKRMLEEKRAGAGGVSVTAHIPSEASQKADDPVAKLQQLKKMLDAGLIAQDEYDETKKRILATM